MFKTRPLYQNDKRWKDVKLGNSKNDTIGSWGGLLVTVTNMLNGIGYSETPETVNEKMKKVGGFQGAFFIPSFLPYIWPNCAYRDMQPCESVPAPIAQIDAAVAAGQPVILQVDYGKQGGIRTQFVLVKEKKGDDYVIYDPYQYIGDSPDKEVLLTKRYKYNGGRLAQEISAVLWFDSYGATPFEPPKMTKVPLPADKYVLYAAEDELALRADPSVGGYLWKRMAMGTELICLEPRAAVKAKMGINGQWVHIQDPNGDQGYVAAWYVSDIKQHPGMLAFVPIEELPFRTQPVSDPSTLIRRIPVTEILFSLEPAAQAIAKVGVTNQWLKVRDAFNTEGYVAAWYVRYASGSQPSTMPTTTPVTVKGGALKVKATAEGIALRTQPVVSDATLIRCLPLGTEFTVTEPNAESKIGKNNQWLKVKDPTGTEGYVAAWFIAAGLLKREITNQNLKVFLCHSSSDKPVVRELYQRLVAKKNIDPWLDEIKLLPGVDWNSEIIQAIKASDVVIVCLSKASINKEGYVQKEIRHALDVAEEKPDGNIFLVPLRAEECEVPQKLRHLQWVNYYEDGWFDKLISSLQKKAKSLGIEIE